MLDPFPQAHRRARFSPKRLALLREGTAEKVVGVLVEDRGVAEVGEIALAGHLSLEESRKAAERLIGEGAAVRLGGDALAGSTFWRSVTGKVLSLLEEYYRRFPLRRGPSQEEVRSRLDLPSRFYSQIISALEVHRFVIAEGSTLRLPGHLPRPSAEQEKAIEAFFAALEASPFSPPELAALDSEALSWLVAEGKMVKLAEGIYLPSSTYREAVQRVVEYVKTKGSVTVAQVRDLLGTSRKYALALLEHLDREKITLRRGDERILLQG